MLAMFPLLDSATHRHARDPDEPADVSESHSDRRPGRDGAKMPDRSSQSRMSVADTVKSLAIWGCWNWRNGSAAAGG